MASMRSAVATAAVATGLAVAPAGAALAASPAASCDAYSQHCPTVKGNHFHKPPVVKGERFVRGPLPFTGADVAAFSIVGAGAIAGGAIFVVAGRRRRAVA
jgi:LPXTG-motif cell wall-anchored protein